MENSPEEYFEGLFNWVKENRGVDLMVEVIKDDWLLIIKLHALVETALNTALIKHLQAPELAKIIGKLETSNPATGKVAFAKALNILAPDSAAFLQKLSELRNFCVHDVRNFSFELDKYIADIDPQKRSQLLNIVNKQLIPEARDNPKVAMRLKLMSGTMSIMMQMQVHDQQCQIRDLRKQLLERKAELYDEHERTQSTPNSE